MPRLVCTSDSHNQHDKLVIPDGDVFIHAGDAIKTGTAEEIRNFLTWMSALPHKTKIFVSGNHERKLFFEHTELMKNCPYVNDYPGINFLFHSGLEIDGVSIYGCASMRMSKVNPIRYGDPIKDAPQTDVLITHNTPKLILDEVITYESAFGVEKVNIGDEEIAAFVLAKPPRIHFFGHCHRHGGRICHGEKTRFYNLAACDDATVLVRQPTVIDIEPNQIQKL